MTTEIWTLYVATVIALTITPGPSQLLMLSNSGAYGFHRSLLTAAGDLSANTIQMLVAGLGLAAIIMASSTALNAIKWVGVCYLIWSGVGMIRRTKLDDSNLSASESRMSLKTLWLQGFLTSAANPKAVVFFAALFPQFISPNAAFWPQFFILSATYIVIDGLFLSVYGASASWIVTRFKRIGKVWIERAGGGFMIVAAILLGVKSISER